LESNGQVFTGCNVEHKFRSHDVHAEVNAISSMIASGCYTLMIVAVVADRDRFTPCGACMDWIMQFSKGECVIITQAKAGGPLQRYTARELMPFYPL
jgi:cytidine deaminase